MSVDGVDVITGQTANPSQSGYVISPRSSLEVQGWRRSLSQTAAFYFTALPDPMPRAPAGPTTWA